MYHYYGLTEDEKKTHLQQYNHALFHNSLSFMDIIWEINLLYGTIVVLIDKSDPSSDHKQYEYEVFYDNTLRDRVAVDDLNKFQAHLAPEKLEKLREEESFFLHLRTEDGSWALHRIVLTPAFDDNGILVCVYLGGLRTADDHAVDPLPPQEMFRDALFSNCYFHFDFEIADGGLIWGDFTAKDGSHPIRDCTGMEAPVPYHIWVEKWYEIYQPEFDKQQVQNIFNVEYFARCFERNERFLDVEVKQTSPYTGEIEYMHIIVLLLQNAVTKRIRACIIWREIDAFRSNVIEGRLHLQNDNESLKRTVSYDDQFRRAALSGSLMVYNINLTKNLIEDEFYEIVDGTSYPMLQLVGLTAPCSFDTFCQRWNDAKVPQESKETFIRLYNRQYLLDAYARGEYQLEIEFDTVIGRGIPVTLRNIILLTRDDVSGDILAMVNSKDVTKQRKEEHEKRRALQAAYDAANRANAAKSDFLARMSHDIRTPMNAIIGMTAIASAHLDDNARVADCLNKITVSSKHLLSLINDVLDMSKIESGKVDLQEEAFVLLDLINALVDICRPQLAAKEHTLNISIHDIVHEHVIGDSQRIHQAFLNLIDNAIKYTPNGGVIRLDITEKPTNRPSVGCYEFIIEDNGIGMSPEFLDRLFEPFERAQDQHTKKIQGTGLGMPITKNIIQLMNGKIEVESKLDQGTKFTVTIFLRLQDVTEAYSPVYAHYTDQPVLVADDDQISGELTCTLLDQLGIRSEWVENGYSAVERVIARHEAGQDYFAVFLDWKMPDMDGLSTTKEIRRRIGRAVPVVIQSAYDWSEIEQQARDAGVNGFISKPLFKSRLVSLLEELLNRSEKNVPASALNLLEKEDFSGKRALMAEDNDLNAEIAEEILGMIGLEIERVVNGQEAVTAMERAADGYYDIVLMDIQMPIMNGLEAAKAIRAIGREYTNHIPILAVSANAFAEDVEASREAGMNDHIAKPLDFEQLKTALNKWIK